MNRSSPWLHTTWKLGVAALAVAAALAGPLELEGQQRGRELFESTCSACHTLGTERIVGPGLAGVEERRDREWLVSFITEPDQMLAEEDSIAVALLGEYEVPMPNFGITRPQAESLIDYMAEAGSTQGGAPTADAGSASGADPRPATEEEVRLGRRLFQGTERLANGGPACNGCHEVTADAVIGGGALARELTTAFSRLGGDAGVRAILGGAPFPVMERAYQDGPLTDEEVSALVAFLERADSQQELSRPRDYGVQLLGAGVAGSLLLLGLFAVTWRGRKRGSVNQEIFDRQVDSV